jgi:Mg2+ and Co2+ transporter CorA
MYLEIFTTEETTESEFINEIADEVNAIEERLFHLHLELGEILAHVQEIQEELN